MVIWRGDSPTLCYGLLGYGIVTYQPMYGLKLYHVWLLAVSAS
jgi:hypothetical protein